MASNTQVPGGCATMVVGMRARRARRWMPVLLLAVAIARRRRPMRTPSPTPRRRADPVTTDFQGLSVDDDYRWLEDTGSAEVRDWIAKENALHPRRPRRLAAARGDLRRAEHAPGPGADDALRLRYAAGSSSRMKRQPPKQPAVPRRPARPARPASRDASSSIPNVLDPKGTTAIDWFVPSHDGKIVAVSPLGRTAASAARCTSSTSPPARRCADVIARVRRHRRRQRRLDAPATAALLHALPAAPASAPRPTRLLPAGLVPQARHAGLERPLRHRQGLPAHRRDRARRERRRPLHARRGGERRRRRARVLLRGPAGRWDRIAELRRRREERRARRATAAGTRSSTQGRAARQASSAAPLATPRWPAPTSSSPKATTSSSRRRRRRTGSTSATSSADRRSCARSRSQGAAAGPIGRRSRSRDVSVGAALDGDDVLVRAARATSSPSPGTASSRRRRAEARPEDDAQRDARRPTSRTTSRCRASSRSRRTARRFRSTSSCSKGIVARRQQPDAAHRLRRLRHHDCSRLLAAHRVLARPRRRLRGGQPARRRRVRRGLAHRPAT